MTINVATTVREIAVTMPGATRVFEKLGIDYCCGGNRTLADACVNAKVAIEDVTASLDQAKPESEVAQPDWQAESLTALIQHIHDKHHIFTRDELPRIEKLLAKVVSVHGANHPELLPLQSAFLNLKNDLEPHLMKEENVLFPYIMRLESALKQSAMPPIAAFGTVQHPVRMMNIEHETAGELLREMRTITHDYALPADACLTYQTLFQALVDFEADLHQHIHLENNILFPKAITAERELIEGV